MRITREEAATLTAKGATAGIEARFPVREGWTGGALVIFVAGRPWNPLNGGQRSYMKHARLRKEWRERTANRLLAVAAAQGWPLGTWPWEEPTTPKRIAFTVYGYNAFDEDALGPVCKSVRDGLRDMAVIQNDHPGAGHEFKYVQVSTRKSGVVHGIAVRIERRAAPDTEG